MTSLDQDLYRPPVEILRRERDHLKARLKLEREERDRVVALVDRVDSELAALIEKVDADVTATEALLGEYREAIARVRR
jgi:hypothetical protein